MSRKFTQADLQAVADMLALQYFTIWQGYPSFDKIEFVYKADFLKASTGAIRFLQSFVEDENAKR